MHLFRIAIWMIRHRHPRHVLEDLRFEVIEENSHSGLDAQAAQGLRRRILGQIATLEAAIASEPAEPIAISDVDALPEI
jgi:hypothetical protein